MYFRAMPKIIYPLPDGSFESAKDIFNRIGFRSTPKGRLALESYYIEEGDTPDIVSHRFYGNHLYHWLIFFVNDITNPYEEWPKNNIQLDEYVKNKYGNGNENAVHHYVIAGTDTVVDYDAAKVTSGEYSEVSNYDYEIELNDEKRQIALVPSEFVGDFVNQYKRLMANAR